MFSQFFLFLIFLAFSAESAPRGEKKKDTPRDRYSLCRKGGVPIAKLKDQINGKDFDKLFAPLFPHPLLISNLLSLEGLKCPDKIAPFLKKCDAKNDGEINLREFKCFVKSLLASYLVDEDRNKCITEEELESFYKECGLKEMEEEMMGDWKRAIN
ncbi:hypothetical protein niasHT_022483 [Heterodera trifolii]|uniref:Uncharacterized protein n=1 Tax=Heterodera trifolii TaxID=157864 RepID=A0ABD2JGX6_9BILA